MENEIIANKYLIIEEIGIGKFEKIYKAKNIITGEIVAIKTGIKTLNNETHMENKTIANKYLIINEIGKGNFGKIYKAKNIRTGELVAIKTESILSETKLLKNETRIYHYLSSVEGIPRVKWFGVDEINNYMVIDLLGGSLEDLTHKYCKLSLNEVCQFGEQMIDRIMCIHKKGLIHRDIKPDNFLLGNNDKLFLIDFGLCKRYRDNDGIHIEEKSISKIIGTPLFVSINVHNLLQPSRRDDLESIGYIMMYMFFGKLPWSENNDKIKETKMETIMSVNNPNVFIDYFNNVTKLRFEEEPNYKYLLDLMQIT